MSTASEITGTESAYPSSFNKHDEYGLSKREYFAGLAMQGLASDSANDMGYRTIANIAVDMADALLEALEDD